MRNDKFRVLKRIVFDFISDCREFSFSVAVGRLLSVMPFIPWTKRRNFYQEQVYNYLKKKYLTEILKFSEISDNESLRSAEKRVWFFWLQGEDNMPPIVSACYKQLLKAAENYEVCLLTESNLESYIKIPAHIAEKQKKGIISKTHFSDIVRVLLLQKYGGLWVDATIYAQSLDSGIFDKELFTLYAPGLFPEFIGGGDFSTFFMAAGKVNTPFMVCLSNLFESYWREHNKVIDYLMFNFFICIMEDIIPYFKNLVCSCPENRYYYVLNSRINEKYSPAEFNKMLGDSPVQKLTYKKVFKSFSEDNAPTNYYHIVQE